MKDLLYALGTILVAFVAWWEGRRGKCDAAYREGHRDGWNAFAAKLQESRAERSLRLPTHVLGRFSPPPERGQ